MQHYIFLQTTQQQTMIVRTGATLLTSAAMANRNLLNERLLNFELIKLFIKYTFQRRSHSSKDKTTNSWYLTILKNLKDSLSQINIYFLRNFKDQE